MNFTTQSQRNFSERCVAVIGVLLLVSAISASNEKCSLNGQYLNGTCTCRVPWEGERCEVIRVLPVNQSTHPGAAAYGYAPNVSSWGASIIEADGTFHMFVAQIKTGGLVGWESQSECIHATSKSIAGPKPQPQNES